MDIMTRRRINIACTRNKVGRRKVGEIDIDCGLQVEKNVETGRNSTWQKIGREHCRYE